ncbi:acyltransferase family protein [Vibrio cyclitrophicus]
MLKRITAIDGMRGGAVLAVVFFHFLSEFPRRYGMVEFEFFRVGQYGVQLFFVISGFVIFMSLEKNNFRKFIISRISRLYPAYWIGCSLTFITISLYPIGVDLSFIDFIINLTMLQAFFGVEHVDGSYWTLTYELVFYFYAITIFISKNNTLKKCLLILFLQLLYGISVHFNIPFYRPVEAFLLLQFFNLFICGILFYEYHKNNITLTCSVFLNVLIVFIQFLIFRGESALVLVFIIFIFYGVLFERLKFLSHPIILHFGGLSYSLYILHQYIGYAVILKVNKLIGSQFIATCCALLLTYILAYLNFILVEDKINRKFKIWLSDRGPFLKSDRK